jgi:hypothetical protein
MPQQNSTHLTRKPLQYFAKWLPGRSQRADGCVLRRANVARYNSFEALSIDTTDQHGR